MNDNRSTVDHSLPPSALQRIDAICGRFEDAWQAGQRPCIGDYLGETEEPERDRLLRELIGLDIDYRRQLGEKPEARDYRERFPSLNERWMERQIGASRYELSGEIGHGGMSTVLQGYDRHLRRDLAVKMLRPEFQDHPYMVRRFLREAWIGARLQHPGIVPVYELGEFADRQPFFTMKLVRGHTLEALLKERGNPTAELPRFLTIFEQVCQTVAYAHAQGVIHRDLKPANIMVGAFGEVQVMDWGLAKVLDWAREEGTAPVAGGDAGAVERTMETASQGVETLAGQALGTYAYMPPEQARGEVDRVDERSDVFGLGAVLCVILTGEPPFRGASVTELLARVKACDHTEAMARLDGCGADAELLRLTKTCLAAEPADRPRNAGVVAEAVKAYLAEVQELLQTAERERAAEQARAKEAKKTAVAERRARRRTLWASVAVVLVLVVGTVVSTLFAVYAHQQADLADGKALDAIHAEKEKSKALEERTGALETSRQQNAERRRALYNATMQEVHHAWMDANVHRSLLLLESDACVPHDGEEDLRGWEYGYLGRLCHKDVRTLRTDASAPDALVFSPDGRWLAAGCLDGNTVEVWTADGGRKAFTLEGHSAPVYCLAFRRDGRLLASAGADGMVRLWDMDTGKTVKVLAPPKAPKQKSSYDQAIRSLAFRPDGKQLAVGGWNGFVTLWDADSGTLAHRFHAGVGLVHCLAYYPNGRWLAYSGESKTARLWDVEARKLLREFVGHQAQISSIVFSADGRTTATSSEDETIGIWDTDSGQRLKLLKGHNAWVVRLCFVPQNGLGGALLASCSDDGTVRVWDVSSGAVQRVFRGHTNRYVRGLAAHPDGWCLASGALDGTIKLWDLAARSQEYATLQADLRRNLTHMPCPVFVRAVFSPDGRLLACPSRDGTVQVWQVGTQKLHQVFRAHRAEVWGLAFTPDGRMIASGDLAGVLHLWEPDTGRIQHTFAGRRAGIRAVAIDRDGRRLASAHNDGTVLLWDLAERTLLHTFTTHEGGANDVIFSPDGRLLASSGNDGLIKLWDVEERGLRRTLEVHEKRVSSLKKRVTRLAFRRDGHRLASGGYDDNNVRLWDPESGELLQTIHGHAHSVLGVAFSPDGRRLASASFDKTIKLWDAENGQEILTLRDDQGSVYDVAFSPDGRWLATAGTEFAARLWESSRDSSPATDQAVFAEHVKALQTRVSSQLRQAVRSKQLKQLAATETAYSEASRAAAALVAADPRDPSFRRQLGAILNEQALVLLNEDTRLAESERLLRQALDIRRDLVNEEPESANEQSNLGGTLNNLAIVLRKSGAAAEARGLAEEAILHEQTALQVNPRHPTYLRFLSNHYQVLGDALLDAGDHAGAAETANRLRQIATPGWTDSYGAARLLARCAGVAEKDAARTAVERTRLIDRYAEQAVNCLRLAIARGLSFTDRLRDSNDFAALRERQDFRLLTTESMRQPPAGRRIIKEAIHRWQAHPGGATSAAYSSDGKFVLSGGLDGKLQLWDADTGKPVRQVAERQGHIWSVALSPDGRQAFSAGEDGNVHLWDVQRSQEIHCFKGHHTTVGSVVFSPDGRHALSGGWDGTLRWWDLESQKEANRWEIKTPVLRVCISPDGQQALIGAVDGTVRLWDLKSGKELRRLKGHRGGHVFGAAFSPDGSQAVTGSSGDGHAVTGSGRDAWERPSSAIHHSVHLLDLKTGTPLCVFEGCPDGIRSVAFSPDGHSVLIGSQDGTMRLWDVVNRRERACFIGHSGIVESVAYSPDGRRALSVSFDGFLRLWQLPAVNDPATPRPVVQAAPAVRIGQELDLAGPTVAGEKFDLKQLHGKVVLIDFWATWCRPCVAEMTNVKRVYDRYHQDGFEVVGVSLDNSKEKLVEFLKAKEVAWPQLFFEEKGDQGWNNPLARKYGVRAIPSTILVDRTGKVVQLGVRGEALEPAVAKLLGKEPAPQ